jgi:3-oxoacyl-[acyl-carrier protein] reductase
MTSEPAKVALVSGGSRGIGRAVALALAADGYDVSFCYHSDDTAANALEKEIGDLGRRCLPRRADVRDIGAIRAWVKDTEEGLGIADVAVTSAGIARDSPLVLMKDEHWHDVVDVNLNGVYAVCRTAVFEMMKRKSGVIINISSVAGLYGNAAQTNYAATKAGIIAFTKSLAKEVGPYGIRVNAVAPGFIETDMTAVLSQKVIEKTMPHIALRRVGKPEEVAMLVSFLASSRAAYITGSVLSVDGGISL